MSLDELATKVVSIRREVIDLDKRVAIQDDRLSRMDDDIKKLTDSVEKVRVVVYQVSSSQHDQSDKLIKIEAAIIQNVAIAQDIKRTFQISNRIFWGACSLLVVVASVVGALYASNVTP